MFKYTSDLRSVTGGRGNYSMSFSNYDMCLVGLPKVLPRKQKNAKTGEACIMKIFNLGLEIEPGKYKYKLEWADKLIEKFSPQKISLYSVEFVDSEPELADAIVFEQSKN